MAMLKGWTDAHTAKFQKEIMTFDHGLGATGLFTDDALADLLDQHPSHLLDVCTRGQANDPKYPNKLRTGDFRDCFEVGDHAAGVGQGFAEYGFRLRRQRLADQLNQPLADNVAVARLTAGFVTLQDQRPLKRPAPPGKPSQPCLDWRGQGR